CVYIAYPTTGNKTTDQLFQDFLQQAKDQFDTHLEENAETEDERFAHLIFDYSTKKGDGDTAVTCFYEIDRKNAAGSKQYTREEHTYHLDSKNALLNINGVLGANSNKKIDLMLKNEGLETADLTDFSIDGDQLTLRWAEVEKTLSVQAVQRASLIDPDKPMIALTFDDGPGKFSREFADLLAEYNGHGTFFVLGINVPNFDESLKYVYEMGNEIASHTYSHKNLNIQSAETVRNEIEKADQAIYDAIGAYPTLIRAPYGNANETVRNIGDRPFIKWNLDTEDWRSRNAQAVKQEILDHVADGDIILMHEIYESTYDGLALTLETLAEQGYQFVTVSELMQYRGVKPEAQTYFSFPPNE
ncbi:MAG: polysaccharide deacetylase family protein, partial [Clostridia bacterium]|nr:polysaccharide deacetylase family protein [Clostridia bacterium]